MRKKCPLAVSVHVTPDGSLSQVIAPREYFWPRRLGVRSAGSPEDRDGVLPSATHNSGCRVDFRFDVAMPTKERTSGFTNAPPSGPRTP